MNQKIKTQNRLLSLLLALALVFGMMPITGLNVAAASTAAYNGIPVTPTKITSSNYTAFGLTESNWGGYNGWYGIRSAAELYGFAELVNGGETTANGVLLQDVALNAGTVTASGSSTGTTYSWTPIGTTSNTFKGNFDGNGCTISGLYCVSYTVSGLFGVIGKGAQNTSVTIKNVILKNSYIEGDERIGGIVASTYGYGASISNCKISEDVTVCKNENHHDDYQLGGIIGGYAGLSNVLLYKYKVTCSVTNCVNLGTVQNLATEFSQSRLNDTKTNAFSYFGAITGAYAEQDNAFEFVPVTNCYYVKGRLLDCNGRSTDMNRNTFTCGRGGTYNRRDNTGCTSLSSISDSHTCVSVTHKEVKATCQYPGCSEYSYCLICGKITSGTKTETGVIGHNYTAATCVDLAKCVYCGRTTGSLDGNNHTGTANVYRASGSDHKKHEVHWSCCDALKGTVDHSFDGNGYCSTCKYQCDHSQMKNKVCQICGKSGTNYLNPVWNSSTNKMEYNTVIREEVLTALTSCDETTISTGWYVVEGNITIKTLTISGKVNLVLVDGAKLSFQQILLSKGNTLNIYAQSTSPSTAGVLQSTNYWKKPVIGAYDRNSALAGTLTINGGIINVSGYGVGIGGDGTMSYGGTVTVNGGIVTANGGTTGIGGTYLGGWLDVNGGIVLMSGSNATKSYKYGLVFTGNNGTICGNSYVLEHDYTIPSGKTLTIEEGKTLTVAEGTTLTIEGSVVRKGTIVNNGTIICKSGHTYIADCSEFCDICSEKRTPLSDHTYDSDCDEECNLCGAHRNTSASHNYENGICKNCGAYQPAVWNNSENCYEISNAGQLVWFSQLVNGTLIDGTPKNQSANAILAKDIDMSGVTGYTSIGTTGLYYSAEGEDKGYSGTFDGNGHVIKNLTFTGSSSAELTYGIFGTLSGSVKNLGVENMNFTRGNSDCRAGGIVGQIITGGSVTSCFVANTTIDANGKVAGGIAGCNYAGTITNCHTYKVAVTASRTGGIVGDNRGDGGDTDRLGTISDCYTTASDIQNSQRTGNVSNCTAGIDDTDFSSGKITWLLNGKSVNGVWKQTLNANAYPNFSGKMVYVVPTDCGGKNGTAFSNTVQAPVAHVYDNGICYGTADEIHYEPAEFDTNSNAYKIANLGNLLWFRNQVNGGNTKINAILTANINGRDDEAKIIGIGTNGNPYEGIFDGNNKTLDIQIVSTEQYAAPFAYVNGATIKNLTVTGSITSSQKFAASFIGATTGGTVTLEKCISKVTITSTVNGDGTNGGLIANVGGGEMKIDNCAFAGAYVTSTATSSGGFVGWTNKNAKTYITNSFLAADFSNAKKDGCNTFSRNPDYATVENCYYLTALGDVPGGATQKHDKQFASGEVAWLLNGSVDNGIWKQTFYTDKAPNFSGGAVYKATGNCDSYTNNEAEKNRNHAADENGCCKYCGKVMNLMPAVWNESEQVYEISNAKQLMWFAELVNGTLDGTKQNQSANAVLMNDIDMSEITDYVPIGGTTGLYYSADGDDKGYKGTFDGNGYVIKNLSVNGSDTKELTYGVFGTLSGTVKHLGVEDFAFILGSKDCRVGGIAGQMLAGSLIEDCYVANSQINAKGKVAGGIAGCNYAGKITNCHTYKVTVTATRAGGIVGDNRGDGGTNDRKGSIINCYTDASSIENSARAGTVTNSTANVSTTDFASGKIGFLLGGSREVWKQTIGSQAYPTFSGDVIKIDGYNVTGTLISAKITWTAMEFTYTAGDWDPSTDSYGAGTWTITDGSGKITVENTGNRRLYTKFTYTSNIGGVTGKFDIGHTAVESKQSVTSKLTLEGKPDSWNSMLGMVEVRISRNPIDNTWNVGDEVKWIGTDGNEYTCTVVSKSNSGYVLITSKRVKQTKGRTLEDLAKDAQAVGGRLPDTNISAEANYLAKIIGTSSVRIPVYRGDKGTYRAFCYKNNNTYKWVTYNASKQHDVYYAFEVPIF